MENKKIRYFIKNIGPLTKREGEVLILVAQGKNNHEIAQELIITESTAKAHVGSIMHKLGTTDRFKAVNVAISRGILVIVQPAAANYQPNLGPLSSS